MFSDYRCNTTLKIRQPLVCQLCSQGFKRDCYSCGGDIYSDDFPVITSYSYSFFFHLVKFLFGYRKPTGAGAQCCYGSDGNLLYAGDSIYGSTVDKGHSQGMQLFSHINNQELSPHVLKQDNFKFCMTKSMR